MWKDRTRVKSESGRSAAALTSSRPFGISDEKGRGRGERRSGMDRPAAAVSVRLPRDAGGPLKEAADFLLQTRRGPARLPRCGADHAQSGRCSEALRVRSPAPNPLLRRREDHRGSGYRSGNAGQAAQSWRGSAGTSSGKRGAALPAFCGRRDRGSEPPPPGRSRRRGNGIGSEVPPSR